MLNLPFSRPGRFYKGNVHTHSSLSDGAFSPEMVVAAYRNAGYDFVALTDHFQDVYDYPVVDTRLFRDYRFTTIIGAELTGNLPAIGDRVNRAMDLVALGLPFDFSPMPQDTPPAEQAKRAADAGAFVAIAHPAASRITEDEALAIEHAHAVEIFNGTVSGNSNGWGTAQTLLNAGRAISVIASDDAHFRLKAGRDHDDFLQAWINVRSVSRDPRSLLVSIKAGDFYSSQGPEIHMVELAESGDGLGLRIACSPVASIEVAGAVESTVARDRGELTFALVPLTTLPSGWIRVAITDVAGRSAWTNPFRLT